MINSLLHDQPYTEIIALRKYFKKLSREMIRTEFDYEKPEYLKVSDILTDIDEILLAKYTDDTNNRYNPFPQN